MATVDVVIPVLNEEHSLGRCIETLGAFLRDNLSHEWRIVVADNGSTDATLAVATGFAESHPGEVDVIHLDERGRGRALKRAWREARRMSSRTWMWTCQRDSMRSPRSSQRSWRRVATSPGVPRLSRESRTERSFKREFISRTYNRIIRLSMGTHFRDAQCGFKAMSRAAADVLLPHIADNGWFFDTELLVIAEKRRFRWKEIPVAWEEDPDTRVKVVKTALDDLRGLARLRFGGLPDVSAP